MKFAHIAEFPSYKFSSCGKVWSEKTQKFLTPLNTNGYHHCVLTENKVKTRKGIHQFMAIAWLGNNPTGFVVNHKNGIKTDNHIKNLEWVSQSQNVCHAYKSKLREINESHKARAALLGKAKLTIDDDQKTKIKDLYTGKRGDIQKIANAMNLSRYVVSYHLKG